MVRDYKKARAVALGLRKIPSGSAAEKVSYSRPHSFDYSTEFTMQFFENTPEELDEQSIQKAALMLLDGYEKDSEEAKKNAERIFVLLEEGNVGEITHFLRRNPCAEWLSLIYLDEEEIEKLKELVGKQPTEIKTVLNEALTKQRNRLVNFGALLDRFIQLTDVKAN